jgi:hypothetical protein
MFAKVPFSEHDLSRLAELNQFEGANWCLVFSNGLSLAEQYALVCVLSPECIVELGYWWGSQLEERWVTRKSTAAYHLVNFAAIDAGKSWYEQQAALSTLGYEFTPASASVVAETSYSIFKTFGINPLLEQGHWSEESVSDYTNRVSGHNYACIGGMGTMLPWRVTCVPADSRGPGVCLAFQPAGPCELGVAFRST